MNTLDITKKLISIPSFVDKNTNEGECAQWLYDYLKTLSWLEVKKQKVEGNRFNIIAKDKFPTEVLICDHIDTIQVQSGWKTNPFKPTTQNGKLYGLGATDTKANIASVVDAIEKAGPTKGLMLFIYVDEEYDFKGALKFIQEYKNKLKPMLIASADGGDLELGNACRGLIEIVFEVEGKAGHAANPASGINTITESFEALKAVEEYLAKFKTNDLGKCTTNLAWIRGGQNNGDISNLGNQGNVIPNYAQFGLEIRNPNPNLNAQKVVTQFKKDLKKQGLSLVSSTIRHDLGAWITKKKDLKSVESLLPKVAYTPAATRGYVDLQMLWKSLGRPTCFTFGAGVGRTAHQANEYIELKSLKKGEKFWTAFLKKFCSVQ